MSSLLWCLHGNLQQPSVWDDLKMRLAGERLELRPVNLWKTEVTGFWDWAAAFCEQVTSEKDKAHFLLGYSLGGRLALHALVQAPELWRGVIVVGADTGLAEPSQKTARLAWDKAWGRRFLDEDWETVLDDWDAQAVFAGRSSSNKRQEAKFSREAVAHLFDLFSKGRQDDLLPYLRPLSGPPLLYVSGEDDVKYTDLGRALERTIPALSHKIVPGAAHRVPWEAPEVFADLTSAFVKSLC